MTEGGGSRGAQTPQMIAVCGKGGAGKTSISGMMAKILMERDSDRILAIDADPAAGLATALGMRVTKTVDDIRNDLVRDVRSGRRGDRREILNRLDYEVLEAVVEHRNLAFLAIGRPEKEGCYCQVNHLLKEIIVGLSRNFDYVIIDGEAGIEQVNRRVMAAVTHLLLVSDASLKGIHVCETIKKVAASAIAYRKDGIIINRVRRQDASILPGLPSGLRPVGTIPESELIRRFDMEGQNILSLPECSALQALGRCLNNMGLPGPGPADFESNPS